MTTKEDIEHEKALLEWTASSRVEHTRSVIWYVAVGVFLIGCLLYSLYTQAWTFTILLVMMAVIYWFTHREPSKKKHMMIAKDGCMFDGEILPWREGSGYFRLQGDGYVELHIERINNLKGNILIHLEEGVTPTQIREALGGRIEELDRREKVLDTFIRICKL